jgi:predicted nucleic acid-binding protein
MTAFFDSNVVLYSATDDVAKADRSDRLLAAGGWISVQVLNETVHVARRKMKLEWARVHDLIDTIAALVRIAPVDLDMQHKAMVIAERYKLSIWDATIVAAAIATGCRVLYSEDMHHGLVVDGQLRIENPFLA